METIENPIRKKTRAEIYAGGIIYGAIASTISAVLNVLGLNEWQTVLVVTIGVVTTATNVLARSHLDLQTDSSVQPVAGPPEPMGPAVTADTSEDA